MLIRNLPQAPKDIVQLRQLGVVNVLHVGTAVAVLSWEHRVIPELGIFKERVNRIQSESSHAAFVPPLRDIEHGLFYFGVAPVQVWLLGIEKVVIPLIGWWIEFPSRTAESREPIVWRLILAFAVTPDIPVALRIVARRARLLEPGMLVRGVVHHEIHDDVDPAFLCFARQVVEI